MYNKHACFIYYNLFDQGVTPQISGAMGGTAPLARQKALAGAVNSCSNLPFVCLGGKWWERLARDEVQQKSTQALT